MTAAEHSFHVAEPTSFSRPSRYIARMAVFVAGVVALCLALGEGLVGAFRANAPLNGIILGLLIIGIVITFRAVFRLRPDLDWLDWFQSQRYTNRNRGPAAPRPELLGPMARMIGDQAGRFRMSAMSMRSLLDGIDARLSEGREISRYLIGLLIFLGLLGTFWGLLQTIQSVGSVINGLTADQGDLLLMFNELQSGLEAPLSGMGTAFSSSLFGLAGSLVLGFLELQASQAQARFYNELEEWLSGNARLTGGGPEGDSHGSAYLQALLESFADSAETWQRSLTRAEEARKASEQVTRNLAEQVSVLVDGLNNQNLRLGKIAETDQALAQAVGRLSTAAETGAFTIDEVTRDHIRSLDAKLGTLAAEADRGRDRMIEEITAEIRILSRIMSALGEGDGAR